MCNINSERAGALRQKFWFMCNGYEILKPTRYYERYNIDQVFSAVDYILQSVQMLSWGTKDFQVDGHAVELPRMLRRKLVRYMFCQRSGYPYLGKTTFEKVCRAITADDTKAKTAVDYASGIHNGSSFDC